VEELRQIRDKGEHLSKAMIDLIDAFEDWDTAQFYREGSLEWRTFVRRLGRINVIVSGMDSDI
jgi:hypothetical protein